MLKTKILLVAVRLARTHGFRALTRDGVASAAGAGMGTINYHYASIDGLRAAVIDYAIAHEIIEVLAQARADRHPRLRGKLTPELKERVANHISGR